MLSWGLSLELRRHPEREPRTATLTLRTATLELQPPQTHPERDRLKPMSVQVILAQEDNPPSGVEPVSWLLLTSLLVTCARGCGASLALVQLSLADRALSLPA